MHHRYTGSLRAISLRNEAGGAVATASPSGASTAAVAGPTTAALPVGPINLLSIVDTKQDAVVGTWTKEGPDLSVTTSVGSRIVLPVAATGGYDLDVEFTRTQGTDSVSIIFPVGTSQTSIQLGEGRASLLKLDGITNGNSTLKPTAATSNNQRHKVAVSVRVSGIEAGIIVKVDGVEVLQWNGDPGRLGIDAWGEKSIVSSPYAQFFGLGVNKSAASFHSARLRVLDGDLKPLRAGVSISTRTAASTTPPGSRPSALARRPVPETNDQQAALALIKEVYKDEFAGVRTEDKKSALAGKLLDQARQATDSTERYVLLGEARKQAIDGDDPLVSGQILTMLVDEFDVPGPTTLIDAWKAHLAKSRPAAAVRTIYDDATARFDAAVTAAEFDEAKQYGDFLSTTALRLSDAAAVKRHLPPYADNPFAGLGGKRFRIEDAKPIFVFDAELELKFLKACDP